MTTRNALAGLSLVLLAGCAVPAGPSAIGPAGPADGPWRQQSHGIPAQDADGTPRVLAGRICRPATEAPARLVVIAHGSPPIAADRPKMVLARCDSEAARWFLSRGYVVAFALRRGYGATGGPYMETSANCTVQSYARAAREAARDVSAIVAYATSLPFVRPEGAVVVGQSAGGWATLGIDSETHPKVIALVSMAGGRGGRVDNVPGRNCHPENLAAAAGELGRTATTLMLWIYTGNDSYFAPPIADSIYQAFTAAGGKVELQRLRPFGADGHSLFFGPGGSVIWGPLIERYLAQQGAAPA